MKYYLILAVAVLLAGCRLEPAFSNQDGPYLRAFPGDEGIELVWTRYALPYGQGLQEPEEFHILMGENGREDLRQIATVPASEHRYVMTDLPTEAPVWIQVASVFPGSQVTRSNIVMAASSSEDVRPIPLTENESSASAYVQFASGHELFQRFSEDYAAMIQIRLAGGTDFSLPGFHPAPHPENNQFLYVSTSLPVANQSSRSWSLRSYSLADSVDSIWTQGTDYVEHPAWSPDGSKVAWLSAKDKLSPRVLMYTEVDQFSPTANEVDVVVDARTNAEELPYWAGPDHPSFNPHGDGIVVDIPGEAGAGRNLRLIDLASGTESPLIDSPWNDTQGRYDPDGKYLAFVSDRSGSRALWLLDLGQNRLRQLTGKSGDPELNHQAGIRWSPDGSRIWFTASPGQQTNCYVVFP